MASEFLQKQRGEFSSFWDREVAGPARETYLNWRNQAVGYLNLVKELGFSNFREKFMAIRRIDAQPDPRMTPGQWEAQQNLIRAGIARSRRNTKIELIGSGLLLVTLVIGYLELAGEQTGTSANIDSQDNSHPSVTAPAPAEAVDVFTATPTQIPPTEIFIPATSTLTETPTLAPTASPPATEYVLDMEHGELFEPVKCEEVEWEKCEKLIENKLSDLQLDLPLMEGWFYPTTTTLFIDGEESEFPTLWIEGVTYLGYFGLDYHVDDMEINTPVLVFGFDNNKGQGQKIIPVIPVNNYSGQEGSVQTQFVNWGPPKTGGTRPITSADLINKELQPGMNIPRLKLALDYPRNPKLQFILDNQRAVDYDKINIFPVGPMQGLEIAP